MSLTTPFNNIHAAYSFNLIAPISNSHFSYINVFPDVQYSQSLLYTFITLPYLHLTCAQGLQVSTRVLNSATFNKPEAPAP